MDVCYMIGFHNVKDKKNSQKCEFYIKESMYKSMLFFFFLHLKNKR